MVVFFMFNKSEIRHHEATCLSDILILFLEKCFKLSV